MLISGCKYLRTACRHNRKLKKGASVIYCIFSKRQLCIIGIRPVTNNCYQRYTSHTHTAHMKMSQYFIGPHPDT